MSSESEELHADLLGLMCCKKKSDLKKLARQTVIQKEELANIILASMCGQTPWLHRRHHRTFTPEHLDLTDQDLSALAANGVGRARPRAQKTINKIYSMFDERRMLSGHMFYTPDLSNWHLLYFDQRDHSDRDNHWSGGPHLHFINWLWPRLNAKDVWAKFCDGNPMMQGSIHVPWAYRLPKV